MWAWRLYEMIHEIEMMSLVWVQHEIWKGWYQCDMVMVWDRASYSGLENNELARFGWEYERCGQWEIVWDVYVYVYCVYACRICLID